MTVNPLRLFLPFALVVGTAIALLVPPFQSPDEPGHFFRAWQVSEGHFSPEKTSDNRLGGQLPVSLDSLQRAYAFLKNDYGAKTSFLQISAQLRLPLSPEKTGFLDFPNTAIYAPTAYLPQAAAIAVLRLFDAPPLWMLYAGRLASLLVWSLFVRSALRRMPFQKKTMAYLALLPASLAIAASFSADTITNGLCFWLIASLLSQNNATNPRGNFFFQTIVVSVICLNKIVLAPLVLLHFLAWPKNSKSRRKHIFRFIILALVAVGSAAGWAKISGELFIPFDRYHPVFRSAQTLNEGVDPAGQWAFVREHPLRFAAIAANSYLESLPATASHLVGKFGWEKNYLPGWSIGLLWLGLVGLVFAEKNPLSRRQRLLAFTCAAICVAAFSATMYALWRPVGSAVLTNLQGRYFVPMLPVFLLAFGAGQEHRFSEKIWAVAVAVLMIGEVAMLLCICQRYYC